MAKAPKEPPHSCPRIDSAIAEMEEARKIHAELRDWGSYWKERCEDMEREHEREIDRLKERISELEDAR